MDELKLSDDQCDLLVAKVLDKLAAKASNQYGLMHALDLNPSITEHHTLRRGLVRAAYMLGAMEQSERLCAAIKEADNKASEGDYMLDSDDCISVIRGTWAVEPNALDGRQGLLGERQGAAKR
jgi:hypothetical protein